jgi:hypothetical protein
MDNWMLYATLLLLVVALALYEFVGNQPPLNKQHVMMSWSLLRQFYKIVRTDEVVHEDNLWAAAVAFIAGVIIVATLLASGLGPQMGLHLP